MCMCAHVLENVKDNKEKGNCGMYSREHKGLEEGETCAFMHKHNVGIRSWEKMLKNALTALC